MRKYIAKVYHRLIGSRLEEAEYQKWFKKHETDLLNEEETEFDFVQRPLYSIVVPLYKTPEIYLKQLIDSVCAQTYPDWELILSDGSGENSQLTDFLNSMSLDPRIRILQNEEQLDISENTNRGLLAARGDYVVFADHDDIIPPYALYECTKAVCENNSPDLIYSDEDKVSMDGKKFFQPHFKPDFNLTLLRSMNYFCHLVVVKKSLQEKVGFLHAEYNGAQDYDFVLRCAEHAEQIFHIPKILYHWRSHAGSIAGNGASKEYAFEAGRKALEAHYKRCGINASVKKGNIFGICHTKYHIQGNPLISVVVSEKGEKQSVLEKGGYNRYEVLTEGQMDQALGDYYLFLDSSISKASQGWLAAMIEQAAEPGTGIVGAHLYQEDGRQKSAGIILGGKDLVYEVACGESKDSVGYFGRNTCAQEYSAVSGMCLLVSRKCYAETGGFDPKMHSYLKYIDLCLRARQRGYLVVYTPQARLISGKMQKQRFEDKDGFCEKWSEFLKKGDPYYNCNQTLQNKLFCIKR